MGVPTAGDDATFISGDFQDASTTYTVTTSGNSIQNATVSIVDLTFNLGGNLTISNALTGNNFVRVTGTGTLSANSIAGNQLTIGKGATVTTSSFSAQNAIVTGGTFDTGNFQQGSVQISQGSTVTSTTVTLSNNFGASTLDGSSWNATGLFKVNNAFSLTIKNGGTLTSGSAETDGAGGVTVDGAGASWKITNDAAIKSTTGTTGAGLDAEHGGLATVGGNLTVSNGGTVFANFYSTTGASEVDVTGKVDVSAASQVYVGQGATLTSAGVVSRSSPFDAGGASNGGILTIGGTWTNTGSFVVGESGSSASNAGNDLQLLTGGTLTTTADLIVGQGAQFSTFEVGNNASVKNVNGVLAQNTGSRTDAFVGSFGGTNSKWTNSGTLTVADAGTANLTVDAGGTVTNTAATVGNQAGSIGFVNVTDGGSWTVNGNLSSSAPLPMGARALRWTVGFGGHLTITGSTLTLGRDAGSVGALTIDNGFAKGTQFNFTGALQVGLAGTGTLQILDGFVLDQGAQSLVLGGQGTANGTLRVSDDTAKQFKSPTQTTYKSTNLTVGSLGQGTLTIANNGFVQTTGNAIVAEMTGSHGMATITDAGSLWQVDGNLIVGDSGSDTTAAIGSSRSRQRRHAQGQRRAIRASVRETGSQRTLVVDGTTSTVHGHRGDQPRDRAPWHRHSATAKRRAIYHRLDYAGLAVRWCGPNQRDGNGHQPDRQWRAHRRGHIPRCGGEHLRFWVARGPIERRPWRQSNARHRRQRRISSSRAITARPAPSIFPGSNPLLQKAERKWHHHRRPGRHWHLRYFEWRKIHRHLAGSRAGHRRRWDADRDGQRRRQMTRPSSGLLLP